MAGTVIIGSYRKAMTSGTFTAGLSAASLVYGFRWAPGAAPAAGIATIAQIRSITLTAGDSATAFTAGFVNFQAFVARGYSTLDTTGGTAGTFTLNNGKLATRMPITAGATCAISTTAAISGGASNLDTDPFAVLSTSVQAVAGIPLLGFPMDLFDADEDEPRLILENNEGFVIKATVPATGTWQLGVSVSWDELA